jgi:predicted ATP-grasp superfamily ATP-dependent carboligase
MEKPTITSEGIARFHTLHSEFKALQDQASAEISTAQLNNDVEITIARDGKAVVVKERELWTEVYHLGPACDAGKILSEKYPAAFEVSAKAEEKKKEMQSFAMAEWGINPLAMSLSDIMRVTEALVDYKLAQEL